MWRIYGDESHTMPRQCDSDSDGNTGEIKPAQGNVWEVHQIKNGYLIIKAPGRGNKPQRNGAGRVISLFPDYLQQAWDSCFSAQTYTESSLGVYCDGTMFVWAL